MKNITLFFTLLVACTFCFAQGPPVFPTDGQTDVFINPDNNNSVQLSWTEVSATSTYEVFLGTTSGVLSSQGNSGNFENVNVDGLLLNTTYFWRIDVTDGGSTTSGPEWSFTTEENFALSAEEFTQADFNFFYNKGNNSLEFNSANVKGLIVSSASPLTFNVYSISGKQLIHRDFKSTSQESIKIGTLSDGIYIARFSQGGNAKVIKFIKN